ncbi:MAG: PQQ-binding-like beta-propeller repeat protein [Planctomycetaceae bacterium]|nr:PQQ-binding-like beta-propeller repeat protein [Planctomycetales bacterium]MCB9927263.1 PQQ-binding-like beta-propeller repeat protein [Planctomycetaceae bacterium]
MASVLIYGVVNLYSQEVEPAPSRPPTVSLDVASNATMAHLARFDALLAEKQWQEAIDSIRQDAGGVETQLVPVARSDSRFRRYIPLAVYRQMKLAELAIRGPEALTLYRRQIDPVALNLLSAARERRDEDSLRQIVTKYFSSSYADEALLELGDLALERGEWSEARRFWEQISPLTRFPAHNDPRFTEFAGQPLWLITQHLETDANWDQTIPLLQTCDAATDWLAYRDPDVALADLQARLTLVSVLEGHPRRAAAELELMRRVYPNAVGEIGGRSGKYVDLLQSLLDESLGWPAPPGESSWPTFAGSSERQRIATSRTPIQNSEEIETLISSQPSWNVALPSFSGEGELIGSEGARVAESPEGLLSYHPIVIDKTVIVQAGTSESDIVARRIEDGSAVFGTSLLPERTVAPPGLSRSVGVPRFPLSSHGQTVYARVGSLPTGVNVDLRQEREEPARIVGLDLNSEGRLTVELRLEGPHWDSEWAFDGVPISDGQWLYIALRHRSSVRSESYVACFDARTARLRWRKLIVGAEPAGSQRPFELTHTLLSLRNKTLYCNTNLGVVAALSARDGAIRWLSEYPRVNFQDENPDRETRNQFRDLTPCLLYRDLVIVAPSDCEQLFALDANTGILVWASLQDQAADAIHLLGVGEEHLIASGDYLYWFDVYTGRLDAQFPEPHRSLPGLAKPTPHGFGRGILVDKLVYWPTRDSILVFDQQIREEMRGRSPEIAGTIDLAARGVTGGNLVLANDRLVIASQNFLSVFKQHETRNEPDRENGSTR